MDNKTELFFKVILGFILICGAIIVGVLTLALVMSFINSPPI